MQIRHSTTQPLAQQTDCSRNNKVSYRKQIARQHSYRSNGVSIYIRGHKTIRRSEAPPLGSRGCGRHCAKVPRHVPRKLCTTIGSCSKDVETHNRLPYTRLTAAGYPIQLSQSVNQLPLNISNIHTRIQQSCQSTTRNPSGTCGGACRVQVIKQQVVFRFDA